MRSCAACRWPRRRTEACYIPLTHDHPGEADGGGGLDFEGAGRARPDQIEIEDALARLKPLLEDPSVLKVGQNAKYDLAVMKRHGIAVRPIDDTMLISYVLEGGLHAHGMDELAKRHLGHEPIAFKSVAGTGKAQKSFKHVELKPATCYAAEDADVTLRLWRILKPQLAGEGLTTVYETLERRHARGAGGHGDRGHPGRTRTGCAPCPASSACAWPSWRSRPTSWPAARSTWAAPSRSARSCSARWAWRAARRPPRASGAPTPRCWRSWPSPTTCRASCWTGASCPS